MFLSKKNQYCENDYTTKQSTDSDSSPCQITNGIFHRTRTKNVTIWKHKRHRFDPWIGKVSWSRKWQPIPIFLPRIFHGQRNLVGYSLWGHKELDTLSTHTHTQWALPACQVVCKSHGIPAMMKEDQFSSVQSLSHVQLFVTP